VPADRLRNRVEIMFGDGTKDSRPQNFEAIKAKLREEGFYWNGEIA
jgi:hypothetical protein